MNNLIAISTYKKPAALTMLLDSLLEFNYHSAIHIADDDAGSSEFVFHEYKSRCNLVYSTGNDRGGIARNKNRGIDYFLKNKEFDNLILMDDDILMCRDGLLDHCQMVLEHSNLNFVSGFWTDFESARDNKIKGSDGLGWDESFPIIAENEWVTWHKGSHGCFVYLSRQAVESVGYMNVFSGPYGFDHSAYFSRLLRASGTSPELFPVLKYSNYWYHGNNIPNNYTIDMDQVWNVNGKQHQELLIQIYEGKNILLKDSKLKKNRERLLKS